MLERFLERVSVSGYKDNFLLKVGMSIQAMVEIETRTTMDMDAIIKGKMLSQSEVSVFIENKFLLPYAELRKFGKSGRPRLPLHFYLSKRQTVSGKLTWSLIEL